LVSLFTLTNTVPLLIAALVLGVIGAQTAVLHLGRPFGAWRAWLGLRTSWLSREIVVFGLYCGLLGAAVGLKLISNWDVIADILATCALLAGVCGVFSSAMIYAVTERPSWNLFRSGGKFYFTTFIFAASAAAIVVSQLWFVAMAIGAMKLLFEAVCNWHSIDQYGRVSDYYSFLGQAARLMRGPLERLHSVRMVLGLSSMLAMVFAAAVNLAGTNSTAGLIAAVIAITLFSAGELLERILFFTAMAPPKMPGGLAT
jgi:DMSO reductase anchor subunit